VYQGLDDGRTVVARKEHRCEWCGESIRRGEKCIKRVYLFDGEFNNGRQHPDCFAAMKRDPDVDDGFEAHRQRRGMTTGESEKAREVDRDIRPA
jgi:hypothetical protein